MKNYLLFFFCFLSTLTFAQIDIEYQTPHPDILDLANAPLPPRIMISTDASVGVLRYRSNYKTIEELSETELRLAGLRINPKTNISSRERYYNSVAIQDIKSGETFPVAGLPDEGRFSNFTWSGDDKHMALTETESNGVSLWIINLDTKTAEKLIDQKVNANMRRPLQWLDNETILVRQLSDNKKDLIDTKATIPSGPTVSVNDGKKAQNRTYQDLLKNKSDEFNFEQLATSEIWTVSVNGSSKKWKDAAMYSSMSVSPDGKYIMINEINRPFSYLVPYYRFPTNYSVYDQSGKLVKKIHEVPLIEDLPKGFMATREGPRSFGWRQDKPATLVFAEALDGGDPENEVEERDAVYQWDAPFAGKKLHMINLKNRYRYFDWGNNRLAIVHDYWWTNRNTKTYAFNPSDPSVESKILFDRNMQDSYNDPGWFVTKENEYGKQVLDIKDGFVHLVGDGYSDEGVYPFVDKMNYKTGEKERIYQADDESKLENIYDVIDMSTGEALVLLQSKTEYPNFYIKNVHTKEQKQITNFENPFAAIQDVSKEVINYKRPDGVDLNATLYLPKGHKKSGEKLPMLMWAYPREYKDASTAGQVTSSPNEFTYPWWGSPVYWVNRGYVVLDRAAFPIIGEGDEEPNDTFREQLVANAKAAIDAVDELGYIDRTRVGVGGHSYGAFMTANLLSHSDLFAAGIARSGAYNRTLTPFGFQAEERNYWEAPEIYYSMSPFMHAEKMKTPLLLIHGDADNNSGTYPMQSERYFNALKGLGATVRLVMLPKESHGYVAKESIMHMLWEQDQWLDKYVKNKNKEESTQPE